MALRHWMYAFQRKHPPCGLVADHAAIAGGPDDRALSLGSQAGAYHAGAHACSRTGRGTARRARRIMRVARNVRSANSELGCMRLSEQHGARADQSIHTSRIRPRLPVVVECTPHAGRKMSGMDDVLDAHG